MVPPLYAAPRAHAAACCGHPRKEGVSLAQRRCSGPRWQPKRWLSGSVGPVRQCVLQTLSPFKTLLLPLSPQAATASHLESATSSKTKRSRCSFVSLPSLIIWIELRRLPPAAGTMAGAAEMLDQLDMVERTNPDGKFGGAG